MSASFLKTVSAIQYVWLGVSIFLLILLILSRTEIFRNALSQSRYTKKELFIFTAVFSILGFCGTLWNFQTPGGIMGFRHIFIILSGFIGGPVVGTLTGLIVGIFRTFTIHTDYAQINGSLSMLQGIAAGLIAMRLKRHGDDLWAWSIIYSALIEVVYWSLYTFVTWPYVYNNVEAVVSMIFTIIITNVPAIGLFFLVLEKTVKSKEREKSETIRNAFNSANRLIHSIHDSTKGPDNSKIPDIIISGLPNLIWAAIITPYSIHFSTNYKNNTHESQGEAETSILQIQRELPTNPHLCKITIQGNGDPTYIYVSKPSDTVIPKTDLEFLNGLAQIIKLITEYSELLKEEKLLQEAEIKTLQAQINPHFLYNTLNTIHFYVRDDPETARKLIRYLSDYFRRSLSNPDRLIPLAEEIKDINAYVELEKARFADRLSVTFDFPEKLVNQVEVPPLLFQPLVENAIIHGVLDKPEGGEIKVGVIEHPDYLKFYVLDTGVGIPPEKRKQLLIPHKKRKNIGLINVHQRLLSTFGPQSGLHIVSRPGKGTIVFTRIPRSSIKEEEPSSLNMMKPITLNPLETEEPSSPGLMKPIILNPLETDEPSAEETKKENS